MIKFFKRKRKLELLKATRSFKRLRRINKVKRQQYRILEGECNRERFMPGIHTLPEAIIELYIEGDSELTRMERRTQREAFINAELDSMFTNLAKEYQEFNQIKI